jgi:hypothetical protein
MDIYTMKPTPVGIRMPMAKDIISAGSVMPIGINSHIVQMKSIDKKNLKE